MSIKRYYWENECKQMHLITVMEYEGEPILSTRSYLIFNKSNNMIAFIERMNIFEDEVDKRAIGFAKSLIYDPTKPKNEFVLIEPPFYIEENYFKQKEKVKD